MNATVSVAFVLSAMFTASAFGQTPAVGGRPALPLPEGAGKDVTQRVCGSTCHGPDIMMGKGRTRDQWTAVVNTMVARGAKASTSELVQISEYLSSHFGPGIFAYIPPSRGNRFSASAAGASGRG